MNRVASSLIAIAMLCALWNCRFLPEELPLWAKRMSTSEHSTRVYELEMNL